MMDDGLFRKYEKVLRLSKEGIGGEREAALKILQTLEAKYPGLAEAYAERQKQAQPKPSYFTPEAEAFFTNMVNALTASAVQRFQMFTGKLQEQIERELDEALKRAEEAALKKMSTVPAEKEVPKKEEEPKEMPVEILSTEPKEAEVTLGTVDWKDALQKGTDWPEVTDVQFYEDEDDKEVGTVIGITVMVPAGLLDYALRDRKTSQYLWEAIASAVDGDEDDDSEEE